MGLLSRLFGPPSKDKFARILLRRLQQATPSIDLIYNREAFQLCPNGEDGMVVNLGNLYAEYCAASPQQRGELLNRCVATLDSASVAQEMPADFEDVKAGIMPSVRARSFFDMVRLSAELELDDVPPKLPVFQPINEQLVCAFVYDSGPAMRFLHQEDLESWGTTIYELMEVARLNFEQNPPMGFSRIGDSFYAVLGDENYGATRLVHNELLARMEVAGDMVAALPNRGTLMITGTESDDGLKIMADLLEKEMEKPRPITNMLFRRVGDDWEPWLPPPEHATYAAFKLAAVRSMVGEYEEQKPLLEKRCEARQDDVFVASYTATQHKETGEITTYCVWSKGISSLLPKTDLIGFVANSELLGDLVPWGRVEQIAGDLLLPQGMYPERYRVDGFPTDRQLAKLASRE